MGGWFSLLCTPGSKVISIRQRKFISELQIGEGGFSYVYRVRDPYSSEVFAIKKTNCQTEELVNASNKELEILKNFKHDNVLHLVDFEVERIPNGQVTKILMPFFEKGTLQSLIDKFRLQKGKYLSEPNILKMFLSACYGLKEFHKRNPPLAHNDLKPGNMLISESNQLVIFDFGSVAPARHQIASRKEAVQLQEWADSNMTALYRAPELFDVGSDASIDERTDIWALGCTLYAMAFNICPFETSATNGSIALAVTSAKFEIPPEANQRLSKKFLNLMLAMMNADHRKRPFIDDTIQQVSSLLKENDVRIDIPNK